MTRLKPTIILAALILGTFLVLPGTAQNYAWVLVNGLPFGPGFEITGPGKFADGSESAPSATFAGEPTTGAYLAGVGSLKFTVLGEQQLRLTNSFVTVSKGLLKLTSNVASIYFGTLEDTILAWDAADTLARRNGTANQTDNHYARYVSTTNFNRTAWKDISATQSGVTGATVTATSLIPDGCALVSVTTSVTTGLGVSNGTTGYSVGDGADAHRWGTISATAAGTDTDNTDWTVTTLQVFNAAQDVVLTALTGNFDGTGVIVVHVGCLIGEAE